MRLSRNRTGYYIKEGFSSIFKHGLMSFASICVIIAFLTIMGSFVLLAVNINAVVANLEDENVILVFIDESLSETEARAIERQIRTTYNVSSANFITREEAFHTFMGRHVDPDRFQDILDAMVVRHRFEVYVHDVEFITETMTDLYGIPEIARVRGHPEIAQGLRTVRNVVSGISVAVVALLLSISLFIMSNTIKLSTFDRREEIAIMRMVGATNGFIRWPFVYEGFTLGISGAVLAFAAVWGLYGLVANRAITFGIDFAFSVIPFSNIAVPMFIAFVAIGFGVGVGGSGMALNKYLKI